MINNLFTIINYFYVDVSNLYIIINKLFTKKDILLIILKVDMNLNKNLKVGFFFFWLESPSLHGQSEKMARKPLIFLS